MDKAIEAAIEAYGRSEHDAGLDGEDPATTVECVLARMALLAAIDAAQAELIKALGEIIDALVTEHQAALLAAEGQPS